jgi:hypothetical protein
MANPEETAEIREYIQRLIEATRSGEMNWSPANPTTYSWDAPVVNNQSARLTLQRVEQAEPPTVSGGRLVQKKSTSHVLQAFEIRGANAISRVTIRGLDNPELDKQMESLYELIEYEKKRVALDFLKSVIPKK